MRRILTGLFFVFALWYSTFGALAFTDGSDTRVDVGTTQFFPTTASVCVLFNPGNITAGNFQPFIDQTAGDFSAYGGFYLGEANAGDFGVYIHRSTTDQSAFSTGGTIAANTWQWACTTVNSAGTPHLYSAPVGQNLAEAGYASQVAGSGTWTSGSSNTYIGNSVGLNEGFSGRIQIVMINNTEMTLAQLNAWVKRPQTFGPGTTLGFWLLGWNGLTSVPDYSGNTRTGNLAGTTPTVGDNAPIGPIFGN